MQSPTFLQLFVFACKGEYAPKTVPADAEPPHGFEPVGAASATALALHGLALDLSAQIAETRKAARKSGDRLRIFGRLTDLASTVSEVMREASGREAEADRLSANLALTLRTLQLLLFAEHPSLYRRDPGSFVLDGNGQEPGVRIVNRLVYAGPEDESYAALPEGHPAAKIGLNLVRAVAGEDRHDELGLPDTLHPFSQHLFGDQATTDEVSPAVAAIRDEPWLRRVAAAIAALETAPRRGQGYAAIGRVRSPAGFGGPAPGRPGGAGLLWPRRRALRARPRHRLRSARRLDPRASRQPGQPPQAAG